MRFGVWRLQREANTRHVEQQPTLHLPAGFGKGLIPQLLPLPDGWLEAGECAEAAHSLVKLVPGGGAEQTGKLSPQKGIVPIVHALTFHPLPPRKGGPSYWSRRHQSLSFSFVISDPKDHDISSSRSSYRTEDGVEKRFSGVPEPTHTRTNTHPCPS